MSGLAYLQRKMNIQDERAGRLIDYLFIVI